MSEPITCNRCGTTWPRDPALEVPCPQCRAPVGVLCKRPSGHGCEVHHSRDRAAMDAGLLEKCPGATEQGADVLLVPNGRGSWAAMSYAQYRRAGLRPMKLGEKRKIRLEIHDEGARA